MPPKTSLTFQQKRALFDEFKRRQYDGEDTSQEFLAQWAQEKFGLRAQPHQTTISRILSTQNTAPIPRSSFIHKRDRTGKHHQLEEALFGWVCDQYVLRRCITGSIIRLKAKKLLEDINGKLPEESRISMKFSGGWLSRFQDRWGLKSRTTRGECGDADEEGIRRDTPKIIEAMKNYDLKDIWNADEFALFYSMAPSRTISRQQLAGRKKEKTRISCLGCSNADGTEKFPIMFIGKAFKPHCFKGKTGKDLCYDYYNNTKAWMTASLFYDWLVRFDKYIGRTKDRKAMLLIDNCSAHGTKETIPRLSAVKVIFLPPNTTSKIQPMDAGIIASVKVHYRKRQMERALDLIDCNATRVYKIDQLTGMRWVTDIWNNVSADVIQNCWRTTGLIHEKLPPGLGKVELVEMKKEMEDIEGMIRQLVGSRDRMALQEFLNPEEENLCTEHVTDEAMVETVVDAVNETEQAANVVRTEEEEEEQVLPSLKEQIRALAVAKLVVDSHYQSDRALLRGLERVQKDLRTKARQRAQQTRIDSFFGTD